MVTVLLPRAAECSPTSAAHVPITPSSSARPLISIAVNGSVTGGRTQKRRAAMASTTHAATSSGSTPYSFNAVCVASTVAGESAPSGCCAADVRARLVFTMPGQSNATPTCGDVAVNSAARYVSRL